MRSRAALFAALMLPTVLVALASSATAQSGALTVVEQAFAAQSSGDVAAALTFYDEAASVQGGVCVPLACVGTAAIQRQLQASATRGSRIRVVRGVEVGNVVTGRYEATSPDLPSGVQRVVGDFTALVTAGRIASLTLGVDASDGQTADALRAIQGLPGTSDRGGDAPESGSEADASGRDGDGSGRLGLVGLIGLAGLAGLGPLIRRKGPAPQRESRVAARGIAYSAGLDDTIPD